MGGERWLERVQRVETHGEGDLPVVQAIRVSHVVALVGREPGEGAVVGDAVSHFVLHEAAARLTSGRGRPTSSTIPSFGPRGRHSGRARAAARDVCGPGSSVASSSSAGLVLSPADPRELLVLEGLADDERGSVRAVGVNAGPGLLRDLARAKRNGDPRAERRLDRRAVPAPLRGGIGLRFGECGCLGLGSCGRRCERAQGAFLGVAQIARGAKGHVAGPGMHREVARLANNRAGGGRQLCLQTPPHRWSTDLAVDEIAPVLERLDPLGRPSGERIWPSLLESCEPLGCIIGPRAVASTRDRCAEPFGAPLEIGSGGPHQVVTPTRPLDGARPVADLGELLEFRDGQRLPTLAALDRGGGDAASGLPPRSSQPREHPREERTSRGDVAGQVACLDRRVERGKVACIAVEDARPGLPRNRVIGVFGAKLARHPFGNHTMPGVEAGRARARSRTRRHCVHGGPARRRQSHLVPVPCP